MKLTLNDFAPPFGATKTVPLTRSERHRIAKYAIARYVRDTFSVGTNVTIKHHGTYYKLSRSDRGYSLHANNRFLKNVSLLTDKGLPHVDGDFFSNFIAERFDPCTLLRIEKLIMKNYLDKRSQVVQKEKTMKTYTARVFFADLI